MRIILILNLLIPFCNAIGQNSLSPNMDSIFRVNKVKQRKIIIESTVNSGVTIIEDYNSDSRLQKSTTCYDNRNPFCPQIKTYKYDSLGKLMEVLNVNLNPIKKTSDLHFMPFFYERFEYDNSNRLIHHTEVDSNNYIQTEYILDYSTRTKTENFYNLEKKITTQNIYKFDLSNNIITTRRCLDYSMPDHKCDSFETKNTYGENMHLVRTLTERGNFKEDIRFFFKKNGLLSEVKYYGEKGLFQKTSYKYSYWDK